MGRSDNQWYGSYCCVACALPLLHGQRDIEPRPAVNFFSSEGQRHQRQQHPRLKPTKPSCALDLPCTRSHFHSYRPPLPFFGHFVSYFIHTHSFTSKYTSTPHKMKFSSSLCAAAAVGALVASEASVFAHQQSFQRDVPHAKRQLIAVSGNSIPVANDLVHNSNGVCGFLFTCFTSSRADYNASNESHSCRRRSRSGGPT